MYIEVGLGSITHKVMVSQNASIVHIVCTLGEDKKSKWPNYIEQLVYSYNCGMHSSTGESPYFLGPVLLILYYVILSVIDNQVCNNVSVKNRKMLRKWKLVKTDQIAR